MAEQRKAEKEREIVRKIEEVKASFDALVRAAKSDAPQSKKQAAFDQTFLIKVKESYRSGSAKDEKAKGKPSAGSNAS